MYELVKGNPKNRSTTFNPEGIPTDTVFPDGDGEHPTGGDFRVANQAGAIELPPGMLTEIGHMVLGRIEELIATMPDRPVAPDTTPAAIRSLLPGGSLPPEGENPRDFVPEAVDLLLRHSTFNGHPRFFGYVTSSAAPVGALADLLASAVNPNVGAWSLAPIATEIEAQTIRWLAELVGFPPDCGGLLVSGGNMANITCALAARTAAATWDIRRYGLQHPRVSRMVVYATDETHTWLDKAVDAMGLGAEAIRKVETDAEGRMRPGALRAAIELDRLMNVTPMMVVVSAGTVSTGAVDPIRAVAAICRAYGVWLHVDGAYGALAAALPEASDDLKALAEVDSIALDPHKWLFAPLEAGCVLVRDAERLKAAFSYHPPYYHFDGDSGDEPTNYYEWSLQNSRGFRALKVWFILRQLGRSGVVHLIGENIRLAEMLHRAASEHPLLQAFRQGLSISTFRYVPEDLLDCMDEPGVADYLNRLNEELLTTLQRRGRVYLSKAVLDGVVVLRACIVNFRTREQDVLAVPELVAGVGEELDAVHRCRVEANVGSAA